MTRTWAGTTLADRQAARRDRLLAAALDLLGTDGSAAVSVRAVCRRAKLTERYFYESFADREQLVVALYEQVAAELRQALVDAVPDNRADPVARAEAAVHAFFELAVDDPRKGRVLLLAPVSDPALSARGVALLPAFAALVREQLPERMAADEREMTALGLVGALANLFTGHLAGTLTASRERLIAHCVHLLARAGS
ncbi:AcrR family transcriptional regulator [Amycolatopsis bartoniae]|uniref:TetR family transcriptional regulator n=1 Tax=Amycolatopsis bartoniae TaxID=941986 RepID=A0A8H9IW33_9PSEU|nr:TetR/AcrR family transcriptional regulator [Amycolatopsis bartoniae]MBB2936895.1 AcrR family transcriptional regulator [Amycolatopsis bartoniae]TVT07265.1 TetR/AcrR family transcriptional regulator [Amycolatopsis bartoniae]GHF50997.1 TetR family transcriptional regulator [Amycolatopsis bartoniae]